MLYTNSAIKNKIKKKEKTSKIIQVIVYIILVPILIYNSSLIVQALVNPNETPNFFGIKSYVIISGSMEPNLNIGDVVITKKCNQSDINTNDIISFREGQTVVTHRVIEIVKTENGVEYITKGDNNNTPDTNKVKINNVEGIYITKIAKIGNFILLMQNKIVIIFIMLFFYVMYEKNRKANEKSRIRKLKRLSYENSKEEGNGENKEQK